MSEQAVDTVALRAMADALTELTTYAGMLRDGASSFAHMLPAEWQGPAMTQFLATFQTWSVSAEGLRAQTESLQQLAAAVVTAYEGASEQLDTTWSQVASGLQA
ncbi:hypothetical protein [Arenivirga flava]|uniref:ESAT-6-like protein n=1 Tax=Arenivirga flava TaxID=1930060 RepID=A0AA37UDQ9_9MICO|nr:hypothetical protein [Arenivirga flava]GMA27244.1 hypothetical protein GCM10025874_04970 [Arenivirga flava]